MKVTLYGRVWAGMDLRHFQMETRYQEPWNGCQTISVTVDIPDALLIDKRSIHVGEATAVAATVE